MTILEQTLGQLLDPDRERERERQREREREREERRERERGTHTHIYIYTYITQYICTNIYIYIYINIDNVKCLKIKDPSKFNGLAVIDRVSRPLCKQLRNAVVKQAPQLDG